MNVSRRRFLAIAASCAAVPTMARSEVWTGRAFGAEVSIDLRGPSDRTTDTLDRAVELIETVERTFSLYDSQSELVRLNKSGTLRMSDRFADLARLASRAHEMTGGLFDPTVQPLWQALGTGGDTEVARGLVGWSKVQIDGTDIALAPGQALTFNGIAQGYATDLVSDLLAAQGFRDTLVNIGEYRADGASRRLGVVDPAFGLLAVRTVKNSAIATSSPLATPLGTQGHIIHADHDTQWSTVSVEAESAALADALSTGLTLAELPLIQRVRAAPEIHRITLIDKSGDLTTL